ncbi:MAG: triose-phosphate isomerase [Thermoplasmata archaeon]
MKTSLKAPIVAVNFKAFSESTGKKGILLAKICDEVAKETGISIIVVPQTTEIRKIVETVEIPVFAQHIDAVAPGSYTGHITAESVLEAGASGTLINHSECRMQIADIEAVVSKCKKAGLMSLVCTNNLPVSLACSLLKPDFVAIEPPELIGGDISVTTADPDIVKNTVVAIKNVNRDVRVLCGAGVKDGKDLTMAIKLGTEGVLLASGIVKAKDPKKALLELVGRR